MFHDNVHQCFEGIENSFPDIVIQCCKEMIIRCAVYPLGAVHRNTKLVASFLSTVLYKEDIKCLNNLDGDDVDVLEAEEPFDDSQDNPLIQNILQVLEPTDSEYRYAPQDIAVLIDTDNLKQDLKQCRQILRNYITGITLHSATTFPRTGIVVDCLDSFHGLDAGVCFYILSSRRLKKPDTVDRSPCRSIYNPKYLTFLASRAIYRAVFVVPKLDPDVFKEMGFDWFGQKVVKVCIKSFSNCSFLKFHTCFDTFS